MQLQREKAKKAEFELSERHDEFEQYRRSMDKKIQTQQKQITKKIKDNMVMVRQSINNINEYMQQASTQSNLEFKQLYSKVQDAVSIMYETLSDQELWPDSEAKPTFVPIDNDLLKDIEQHSRNDGEKELDLFTAPSTDEEASKE